MPQIGVASTQCVMAGTREPAQQDGEHSHREFLNTGTHHHMQERRRCQDMHMQRRGRATQRKQQGKAQTKCGDTRGVPTRWNWCPSTCPSSQCIPSLMIFKVLQEGGSLCVRPRVSIQFMQYKVEAEKKSRPRGDRHCNTRSKCVLQG